MRGFFCPNFSSQGVSKGQSCLFAMSEAMKPSYFQTAPKRLFAEARKKYAFRRLLESGY